MNRATLALLRLLCAFHPDGCEFWLTDDEPNPRCVKCRTELKP